MIRDIFMGSNKKEKILFYYTTNLNKNKKGRCQIRDKAPIQFA